MKNIFFVRHASSVGNENNEYQHLHSPLSKTGRTQAKLVAERFRTIPIDLVITSPLERAAETARYIAETNQLQITIEPLFQEILRPSILRGQRKGSEETATIKLFLEANWAHQSARHSDEENFYDLRSRALSALEYLIARPEENLLVVTHGTFLRTPLAS